MPGPIQRFSDALHVIEQFDHTQTEPVHVDVRSDVESVHISGMRGNTAQKVICIVNGTCQRLVIESSQNLAVVFDGSVRDVELLDSQKIELQCTGMTPELRIKTCDRVKVYLSEECAQSLELLSELCSSVNVFVPDGDDQKEIAIPEQIVTQFDKFGTGFTPVSLLAGHGGELPSASTEAQAHPPTEGDASTTAPAAPAAPPVPPAVSSPSEVQGRRSGMAGLGASLAAFNKGSLSNTITRIRTKDGRLYEENVAQGTIKSKGREPVPSYLSNSDRGFSVLEPAIFFQGDWIDQANLPPSATPPTVRLPDELSFVTYNVWFKDFHLQERAQALFAILQQCSPDIFCLQEVTEPFLDLLKADSFLRDNYCISDHKGLTCYPYGVLMGAKLSSLPLAKFRVHHLPSNMGRRLVTGVFDMHAEDGKLHRVVVGEAHLESKSNRTVRISQLETLFPILDTLANNEEGGEIEDTSCFYMGDFNFDDGHRENHALDGTYADAWLTLKGHTRDAYTQTDGTRIDKVLARSAVYQIQTMERLGMEELPGLKTCPSDHFGLWAVFHATGGAKKSVEATPLPARPRQAPVWKEKQRLLDEKQTQLADHIRSLLRAMSEAKEVQLGTMHIMGMPDNGDVSNGHSSMGNDDWSGMYTSGDFTVLFERGTDRPMDGRVLLTNKSIGFGGPTTTETVGLCHYQDGMVNVDYKRTIINGRVNETEHATVFSQGDNSMAEGEKVFQRTTGEFDSEHARLAELIAFDGSIPDGGQEKCEMYVLDDCTVFLESNEDKRGGRVILTNRSDGFAGPTTTEVVGIYRFEDDNRMHVDYKRTIINDKVSDTVYSTVFYKGDDAVAEGEKIFNRRQGTFDNEHARLAELITFDGSIPGDDADEGEEKSEMYVLDDFTVLFESNEDRSSGRVILTNRSNGFAGPTTTEVVGIYRFDRDSNRIDVDYKRTVINGRVSTTEHSTVFLKGDNAVQGDQGRSFAQQTGKFDTEKARLAELIEFDGSVPEEAWKMYAQGDFTVLFQRSPGTATGRMLLTNRSDGFAGPTVTEIVGHYNISEDKSQLDVRYHRTIINGGVNPTEYSGVFTVGSASDTVSDGKRIFTRTRANCEEVLARVAQLIDYDTTSH